MPRPAAASEPAPEHARGSARRSYADKRDFTRTPEPAGAEGAARRGNAPIFVVQKHDASRLHWDFRLEQDGVLWSWAVPKGPSLDPADKRLAVHVEDHPLDYANFSGTIPEGNYGAGTVEIWDRGYWTPLSDDPVSALRDGELKFTLDGARLQGGFVLVRLKPRGREKAENWLLIKERDDQVRAGVDAAALEREGPLGKKTAARKPAAKAKARKPSPTALPPEDQAPQLATLVAKAPEGAGWISEVKYDGYRMLVRKTPDDVRIITRNGLDWTHRLSALADAVRKLVPETLLLDGELVVSGRDGMTSFAKLQAALSDGKQSAMRFIAFDLLFQDGEDLRERPLSERKAALHALLGDRPPAMLSFSEHLTSEAARVRDKACAMGLEGIVCKRLDAPYRGGRGRDWVKVKCDNREEFVILGWTDPQRGRVGFGSLQLGYHDEQGRLHFVGGCGTGFDATMLRSLRKTLDALGADAPPDGLLVTEAPPRGLHWVKPELVAELRFAGFTGGGMLRQARFLGLREDKPAAEVVRPPPESDVPAQALKGRARATPTRIVHAPKGRGRDAVTVMGQMLTHPDKALWPGISKRDLAEYWEQVAEIALPGIAQRPLALVRCPDGIGGEHFFQKHAHKGMSDAFHEGTFDDAPYVAIADARGLAAAAQIAAIELHSWGSSEADAGRPDRLVFDLDPGDDTRFADVVAAAKDVRARLEKAGLASFCRTSGGKGLHVVVPLTPQADWDTTRAWCRAFAETMQADDPDRYIASTRKSDRKGRILVDWLRNGLGSTAVASFSPRARPNATVAVPLAWREVTAKLDPQAFTIRTVPQRLKKLRADPWSGFAEAAKPLPAAAKKGKR